MLSTIPRFIQRVIFLSTRENVVWLVRGYVPYVGRSRLRLKEMPMIDAISLHPCQWTDQWIASVVALQPEA